MLINLEEIKNSTIKELAKILAISGITAPKARGQSNLEILIITDDTIKKLSEKMIEIKQRDNKAFFERDAINIANCEAILLIGTEYKSRGLDCGLCGYNDCKEKERNPNFPCVFDLNDLGISIGSIVSLAAQFHLDNRIMYSVGKAAIELNLFSEKIKFALGVPLTAQIKNPFFDRKPI
ncbi:MAG: DUF2148 domain-containing protein [Bacteroidales bacterium]|nr:DUF2148 domain-containing protein [Bacteroidales bacterium]